MNDTQKRDYQFYLGHQHALISTHGEGKYIVIKGQAVLGVYDSDIEALSATAKDHPAGSFIVQRCEPVGECWKREWPGEDDVVVDCASCGIMLLVRYGGEPPPSWVPRVGGKIDGRSYCNRCLRSHHGRRR